jgi:hypothetical protein
MALGHVRSVEALLARGRITAAEAREELEDLVRTGTIPAELGAQALARIP